MHSVRCSASKSRAIRHARGQKDPDEVSDDGKKTAAEREREKAEKIALGREDDPAAHNLQGVLRAVEGKLEEEARKKAKEAAKKNATVQKVVPPIIKKVIGIDGSSDGNKDKGGDRK